MYTTPRKVKQESRLRRSLSLTTGISNPNNQTMKTANGNGGTTPVIAQDSCGSYQRHLHLIQESSQNSSTYFDFNEDLTSCVPDLVQPPPYRLPPPGEDPVIVVTQAQTFCGLPDSPGSIDGLQIHSSKFPIVKQVVLQNQEEHGTNDNNNLKVIPILSPEYIKKFQQQKVPKKKSLPWIEQRRAYTLDSSSAKEIQQSLSNTIGKANSTDLGKVIQDFNEEQHLMSFSGPYYNPYGNTNGGVMSSSYYSDNNSSTSQSNTDNSLDTVIFKGGPSSSSSTIRDWQRSQKPMENHNHHQFAYPSNSYQGMQQQTSSSSHSSYPSNGNGNGTGTGNGTMNGYSIEYRHHSPSSQQPSNLSVHSIPTTGNRTGNSQQHFPPNQHPASPERVVTFSDQQKEQTKLFPTKTYNQIKDMISSRFGHQGKPPNPTSVPYNGNGNGESANAYIDLTMGVPSSYNGYRVGNGGTTPYYHPQAQTQAYRSPNIVPKNHGAVNTSFRKAIQQSTLKSNLTEDSLQLRPIMEQGYNGPQPQERAQQALDKLIVMENPSNGPTSVPYRIQQFNEHNRMVQQQRQHQQRVMASINPGPGSSGSSQHVDSALSSPGWGIPPPPPTAQAPSSNSKKSDSPPTIGLPLSEPRENGDGSSATQVSGGEVLSSSDSSDKVTQRVGSGQSHTTSDSGIGGLGMSIKSPLNSNESSNIGVNKVPDSGSSGNDSEWVDLVEPEIQQILDITQQGAGNNSNHKSGKQGRSGGNITNNPSGSVGPLASNNHQVGNTEATGSKGIVPLPLSPNSPKLPKKFDLSTYNKKQTISSRSQSQSQSQEFLSSGPSTSQGVAAKVIKSPRVPVKVQRSNSNSKTRPSHLQPQSKGDLILKSPKMSRGGGAPSKEPLRELKGGGGVNVNANKITRNAMTKLGQLLHSLQIDETGSTTGLDFEDGQTECTSDDDDLSTTIDTTDAHAIRRQLESLESMYTEVLKVLGEKKFARNRYPPTTGELRGAKRRGFGSMSSLPSSVSSRPFRERSRKLLDDKKKIKDLKSINRRFQRLESHVVTLARSVAHLSSEMRTQHLMVQEMESIRNELQQLRNQVMKQSGQSTANFQRGPSGRQGAAPCNQTDWTSFRNALPSLTNPCRVRKLTQFFGDEPPLIRIFLKKLGYEKYAPAFESERIGIMELPYLTEERLNKMGIPMGPRLRILQEAQLCLKPGGPHDPHHHGGHGHNGLSVYVV